MQHFKIFGTGLVLVVMVSCAQMVVPEDATATPRSIRFSGYDWTVRRSERPTDPGGNRFSDATSDVWVDGSGQLHLTLGDYATEVRMRRSHGYGIYEARLIARLDRLDPQAVFGFFTFELPSEHPYHREIDIEFSRWGDPDMTNAQFSVQPAAIPENRLRFALDQQGEATTHRFTWTPGRVEFVSWHGHSEYPPAAHLVAARFVVEAPVVPDTARERIYFNFWRYQGKPLQTSDREKVIVREFRFIPLSDLER